MKRRAVRRRRPASRRRDPVVISGLIRETAARLKKADLVFAHGATDSLAEAAFLVGETLGIHPDHLEARAGMLVTAAQQRKIASLTARRIRSRKPAAYLLHRIYMLGVPFYIDERAIVPRSYLGEILADGLFAGEDFSLIPDADGIGRIFDLCTGSGCLAILAAVRFAKAGIDAVELSDDALQVARKNIAGHKLGKRVRLLHGDLFEPVGTTRYDLIIANPPYVDSRGMATLPRECRHEPRMAFDGGADGLAVIRRIIDGAGHHLNKGGGLLCEVGRRRQAIERAYPDLDFLWLDTADSSGEVFWLDARQLL